jgi:methyl-accepting chemotaxis protein
MSQCERLLAALPTPVYAVDGAGKVTAWNAAMEACTGVAAADIVGRKAWTAFSAKKMLTPADLALSSAEEETDDDFAVTHKGSGAKQSYRVVARPILEGDEAKGAVATLLDQGGGGGSAALEAFRVEMLRMADEHIKGDIDVSIPVEKFEGVYRTMAEGVNAMVAGHIAVKKKAMACIAEFGKGNFEAQLEQFPGKKAFINETIERLRSNIKGFVHEMHRMADEHIKGDIDVVIPVDKFEGSFRDMCEGVNTMVAGHIAVKKKAMACIAEFGKGNFEAQLEQFPGKKAFINETIERLRANLKSFIVEMHRMSDEHNKGDIDVMIPADRFEGAFRTMSEGVNTMVGGHIAVKKKAMACIGEFGRGNFEAPLEKFPGKKAFINETIEQVRANLKALIQDSSLLVQSAVDGRLSTRAEANRHQGDFRKIVEGVNATLDAVLAPIAEATDVLEKLAQRNLTVRVKGDYKGDHARIKEAINASVSALQESLTQVSEAVDQVAAASGQIASSSQAVAQGASEQASSLEQVSSSLEEMSGMTKQNADNTQHAKTLAQQTKLAADKGSEAMTKMVDAMTKIRVAAEGTAEIIRDINEISFQTNLLALNAAVEAARAGDAGRGFAVVAEEVRNLALRSKDAAKKTEDLIKQSVQLSDNGQVISKEVNGNLLDIVESVGKVTGIIGEITAASQEQARGIDHVTSAMSQMDKVTQQNAANSEESSSAAEELSSQSEQLAGMVGTFEIGQTAHTAVTSHGKAASGVKRAVQAAKPAKAVSASKPRSNGFAHPVRPEEVIPLESDPDFKQF